VEECPRGIALRARILHDLGQVAAARTAFEQTRSFEARPFARRALWEAEHLIDCQELEQASLSVSAQCVRCVSRSHSFGPIASVGRDWLALLQQAIC